jgi:hypothetical protein
MIILLLPKNKTVNYFNWNLDRNGAEKYQNLVYFLIIFCILSYFKWSSYLCQISTFMFIYSSFLGFIKSMELHKCWYQTVCILWYDNNYVLRYVFYYLIMKKIFILASCKRQMFKLAKYWITMTFRKCQTVDCIYSHFRSSSFLSLTIRQ